MKQRLHVRALFLFLSLAACTSAPAFSQTLEEVSFGPGTNTYLSGINNRGFICGYYDSAGATMGFVINPNGKIIRAAYSTSFSTKFMKINDHNLLLINKTTGTTIDIYKAYYDTAAESFGSFIAMSNNQQPTIAQPFGLNNKNDFSGWYQGAAYRFLWVNHDSIPATPQWVFDKYLTYNTIGTALNDNGKATGFYINGSSYGPFLYDVPTNTFTILNTAFHMQPYGINNNNVICGQYWATSGYLTAFWGPVNGSGIVTTHAMNTLWKNPLTQSVANGINDKTEIVGSYVHPVSGSWVGFIYRPNTPEYRLPGYDFNTMTWKLANTTAFPANDTAVWTPRFTGTLNYTVRDPYNPGGPPVIDSYLVAVLGARFCYQPNLPNTCADWRSFAKEVDNINVLSSPLNYDTWKHRQYVKLVCNSAYGPRFGGTCYGFAYTSLMKYIADSVLFNRFGIPVGTSLRSISNYDSNAITAIVRSYLKQYDPGLNRYQPGHRNEMLLWSGLYRLKSCYLDTVASRRDPRAVFMMEVSAASGDTSWHEVLPFKIKTPKSFPFDDGVNPVQFDTMYVYDSNYPYDSLQHYTVKSTSLANPNSNAANPSYTDFAELCFNEVSVREIMPVLHAALKATAAHSPDSVINLAMPANHFYAITGSGNTHANYTGHTPANGIPYLTPASQKDNLVIRPKFYATDTLHSVAVTSYNYLDSSMIWNISDKHRILGITRAAMPAESDNGTWKSRMMSYGTHDAAPKLLNGYLMESDDDPASAVNILARNITMSSGDSILTENPSHFVYKLTRFGTGAGKYDLWVYMAGADSQRQFRISGIPIAGGSSHTVVPYSGPTGKSVIIQVDLGNNGTIDSTIIVPMYTLGVRAASLPAGDVIVYPNPAGRSVTISWKSALPLGCRLSVLDISGRSFVSQALPVSSRSLSVSLDDMPPGIYLLRIADAQGNVLYSDKLRKE